MSIYSKIIDIQKLIQAWERVKKNRSAPGVDDVTYEIFEERRREEIKQLNLELSEHRYESRPVKQTCIFKGEKERTITLFTMRDKVVQQSVAKELGKVFEPLLAKSAYAYRPGQSALEALNLIEKRVCDRREIWVLKMDIANYFDSIRHDILLPVIREHTHEDDVTELIRSIITAPVFDEKTGELTKNRQGIFQGAVCAPLLSNVYLMEYDREMERQSDFYIRYSDDILILERTKERAEELYDYSKGWMQKRGLELKETKTMLCRLDENGFNYLGYTFSTQGKSIPAKAVDALNKRLEEMWLTPGNDMAEKIKKGQEILGGWEQYYREEREPETIIEYVLVLSMVQNKDQTIRDFVEEKRFRLSNYYKDIAKYMANYWKERDMPQNMLREYEQFWQVPEEPEKLPCMEDGSDGKYSNMLSELLRCYEDLTVRVTEETCTDIMQLYTDVGAYRKAEYFWELKSKNAEHFDGDLPDIIRNTGETAPSDEGDRTDVDLKLYGDLFAGREDSYARLSIAGKERNAHQVNEPLTEEQISRHLRGGVTLAAYVQRPNKTAKYVVFDIDVSKKVLLQYTYNSSEFLTYKQKAAEYAYQICRTLKRLGSCGYIEDTGYRGYHVWVFFTEWIPVRYINQFTECIRKETPEEADGVTVEYFPDSSRVKNGKPGQKITLPLGRHIRTGERSRFLDVDFQPVNNYRKFLGSVAKLSLPAMRRILGLYSTDTQSGKARKEVDADLSCFGAVPETVRIVLERCNLIRYLCQKAATTGYLSHFERLSVLYVFGHMGDDGKEFVHTVMGFTLNYQYNTTQKFILKLPAKPVSCVKLREQYKLITAEYGCNCIFKRTKNCYPSPVLHAIKNSGQDGPDITIPMSRAVSKEKKETVYEELNIHKQTENLTRRIVELKKQRRGLDKAIGKVEEELEKIFDNAGIDCIETEMGMLVRRKKTDGYEWLIEL